MDNVKFTERLKQLVEELNAVAAKGDQVGTTKIVTKERTKFVAIDFETSGSASGAFLVEKATGEIYNIKGYGVPDRNKKLKADIGNIFTVEAAQLYGRRWNYLR